MKNSNFTGTGTVSKMIYLIYLELVVLKFFVASIQKTETERK